MSCHPTPCSHGQLLTNGKHRFLSASLHRSKPPCNFQSNILLHLVFATIKLPSKLSPHHLYMTMPIYLFHTIKETHIECLLLVLNSKSASISTNCILNQQVSSSDSPQYMTEWLQPGRQVGALTEILACHECLAQLHSS